MNKKFAIYLASIIAVVLGVSCNSTSPEWTVNSNSSVAVSSFYFAEDDSVLADLDSVFFSIDLVKGQIFNADSLPVGTDVTALKPVITTVDGCAVAELTVNRGAKGDTVYNYLTSSDEAIDFTNPVKLRIVSNNGLAECTYTIRVNVHKVDADSLFWDRLDRLSVPSLYAYPKDQHTVKCGTTLKCLTTNGTEYCIATLQGSLDGIDATAATLGEWDKATVTFDFEPDINSFTGDSTGNLYILATNGDLYASTDGGFAWTATGLKWHAIYGAYASTLLGSTRDSSLGWAVQTYPDGTLTKLDENMPVSGTSAPVTYTFAMSDEPQMLIVGGRKANGSLSSDTWGYDGDGWACITRRSLPVALEGAAVAPFVSLRTTAAWVETEIPTLLLIGGRRSNGSLNDTVYISDDYGFNWYKAPSKLQLPSNFPAMYNSQVFTVDMNMTAAVNVPKIIKPVENWICPYLYLFGGVNSQGNTSNNVWRGTINRLSFKPVE